MGIAVVGLYVTISKVFEFDDDDDDNDDESEDAANTFFNDVSNGPNNNLAYGSLDGSAMTIIRVTVFWSDGDSFVVVLPSVSVRLVPPMNPPPYVVTYRPLTIPHDPSSIPCPDGTD